uniref:Putative tick transposon n=1 Tax=Ixodes ricinus TaxID=34613 RepID=A0A6B0UWA9_IXORI
MLLIYHALFCSYFDYCFLVWGTTTKTNVQRLFIMQKRAIRIICNVAYDHSTISLFKKLDTLKITNYYSYKLLMSYKRSLNNPVSVFNSVSGLESRDSAYSTRHSRNWAAPRSRTTCGDRRLAFTLPRILNNLEAKGISMANTSKREIRDLFE